MFLWPWPLSINKMNTEADSWNHHLLDIMAFADMNWFLFIKLQFDNDLFVSFATTRTLLPLTLSCLNHPMPVYGYICAIVSAGWFPSVFIPWCSPFFHIWPAAMSQQWWSKISTPRHNSLSGKHNPLLPQSSYIVWDDSESEEAYCLDVFVVQVHHCRMWGFPLLRVFLDLCVNSRELCIVLCSAGLKGGVCAHVGIRLYAHMITGRMFICMHFGCWSETYPCCHKLGSLREMLGLNSSKASHSNDRPLFHFKFHGAATQCFRFDISWLGCSVLWKLFIHSSVLKLALLGHLGVSDLTG